MIECFVAHQNQFDVDDGQILFSTMGDTTEAANCCDSLTFRRLSSVSEIVAAAASVDRGSCWMRIQQTCLSLEHNAYSGHD